MTASDAAEPSLVMLATDGSELSHVALAAGLRIVPADSQLVLATVIPAPDPSLVVGAGHSGPVMSPAEKEQFLASSAAQGRDALDDTAKQLDRSGIETVLLEGDPGTEICRFAAERGVDVIVLGTRGRGGLKRAILGSVSDHVVRNAPCPVLTVGNN